MEDKKDNSRKGEKQGALPPRLGARIKAGRAKQVRDAVGTVSSLEDILIEEAIASQRSVAEVIGAILSHRKRIAKDRAKGKPVPTSERLRQLLRVVRQALGRTLTASEMSAILRELEKDPSLSEKDAVRAAEEASNELVGPKPP